MYRHIASIAQLGSNSDPCYIQNRVVMKRVIKRSRCIKIVVSMATDRSHRLIMGKTKKIFFSETTRPTALIFGM